LCPAADSEPERWALPAAAAAAAAVAVNIIAWYTQVYTSAPCFVRPHSVLQCFALSNAGSPWFLAAAAAAAAACILLFHSRHAAQCDCTRSPCGRFQRRPPCLSEDGEGHGVGIIGFCCAGLRGEVPTQGMGNAGRLHPSSGQVVSFKGNIMRPLRQVGVGGYVQGKYLAQFPQKYVCHFCCGKQTLKGAKARRCWIFCGGSLCHLCVGSGCQRRAKMVGCMPVAGDADVSAASCQIDKVAACWRESCWAGYSRSGKAPNQADFCGGAPSLKSGTGQV